MAAAMAKPCDRAGASTGEATDEGLQPVKGIQAADEVGTIDQSTLKDSPPPGLEGVDKQAPTTNSWASTGASTEAPSSFASGIADPAKIPLNKDFYEAGKQFKASSRTDGIPGSSKDPPGAEEPNGGGGGYPQADGCGHPGWGGWGGWGGRSCWGPPGPWGPPGAGATPPGGPPGLGPEGAAAAAADRAPPMPWGPWGPPPPQGSGWPPYGDPYESRWPHMPSPMGPWGMDPVQQAYYAGLQAGAAGRHMPGMPGMPPGPPSYDAGASAAGLKTRRRREQSKPPPGAVPYNPQAPALDSVTGDQLRCDLEVPYLQNKLKDLAGEQGAEVEEQRKVYKDRLAKLPQMSTQKSAADVIQYFKDNFLAEPQKSQGALLNLAFDKEGCRLVQSMLECADLETTLVMHAELAPNVRDMAGSPHANYVVTKMIEVAPVDSVGLVIKHLSSHAEQIARHRYGCRIICRLLQRSFKRMDKPNLPELPGLEGLVREVLGKAQALCCHIFAHHVIQSILENTLVDDHKHEIFLALHGELQRCAQDRHASFVIQAALKCCSPKDVKDLADGLIDMLPQLATTRFGSYVYNTLCVQENTKAKAIGALREHHEKGHMSDSTHGMKLVKQVLFDQPQPQEGTRRGSATEWLGGQEAEPSTEASC